MDAGTLRCPGCGAPATADLHGCTHCGARLATVACPSCFGMVFRGTAHCPHCGDRAGRAAAPPAGPLPCPACRAETTAVRVGETSVRECGGCGGLWLDNAAFDALCADRERHAGVLAFRAAAAAPAPVDTRVRYRHCPECGALMHRVNFQRASGVIVDVCRDHGTWFDADELRRIVEFIQSRGAEMAHHRERMRLEEERRKLEDARLELAQASAPPAPRDLRITFSADRLLDAIARLF